MRVKISVNAVSDYTGISLSAGTFFFEIKNKYRLLLILLFFTQIEDSQVPTSNALVVRKLGQDDTLKL